jgi:hypothetical protein
VATKWEFVHFRLFLPHVKNVDLGIRYTWAKAKFWVWLVLTIPVTWGGAATHGDTRIFLGEGKEAAIIS